MVNFRVHQSKPFQVAFSFSNWALSAESQKIYISEQSEQGCHRNHKIKFQSFEVIFQDRLKLFLQDLKFNFIFYVPVPTFLCLLLKKILV